MMIVSWTKMAQWFLEEKTLGVLIALVNEQWQEIAWKEVTYYILCSIVSLRITARFWRLDKLFIIPSECSKDEDCAVEGGQFKAYCDTTSCQCFLEEDVDYYGEMRALN